MVNIFFTFCGFFPSFISNTSIVSIHFEANLDAQNAGNGISVLQISKIFWGSTPKYEYPKVRGCDPVPQRIDIHS
jgi:hypothetical protein